jgi:hypothetical protein
MALMEPVCECGGILCSVGDCRSLGNALNAVHAAFDLAAAI